VTPSLSSQPSLIKGPLSSHLQAPAAAAVQPAHSPLKALLLKVTDKFIRVEIIRVNLSSSSNSGISQLQLLLILRDILPVISGII
jgi:hypothetical protein